MTEELKQKAEEYKCEHWSDNVTELNNQRSFQQVKGTPHFYGNAIIQAYIAGATENGIKIHDLRKNPNDLPECDESKQITFYVEEWIESIQKYYKHYCLGFYKKSFLNDDIKLFVEKSKGYENEHLPKTVLFWYENPTV